MGKKIISFSLYGDNPDYQEGALNNLELNKQIYPGWICRFYVSQEIPEHIIAQLLTGGAEVIRKERKKNADGMFWRFLAAGDPGVDYVIVRDTDSRSSQREREAVDSWIENGKGFHIMRDHPWQRFLIMGSLWGCRKDVLPDIEQLINRWLRFRRWWRIGYGQDEEFLARVVYPLIKNDVLIHSDYVAFEGEIVIPFPSERKKGEILGLPIRRDISAESYARSQRDLHTIGFNVYPSPSFTVWARSNRYLSDFRSHA